MRRQVSISSSGAHLAEERYNSASITLESPISLGNFQDWLCTTDSESVVNQLVRAKGTIRFSDFPQLKWEFNQWGRRRVEVECVGHWQSTPVTQIVSIARDADRVRFFFPFGNLVSKWI